VKRIPLKIVVRFAAGYSEKEAGKQGLSTLLLSTRID